MTTQTIFAPYHVAEAFDLVISPNHTQFEVFYGGETTPGERFWFSGNTAYGGRYNEFYAYNFEQGVYFLSYYDFDGIFMTTDDLGPDTVGPEAVIPAHIREALSA
jgi:hypothetical protein